jgi:hypothetical protein
LGERLREMARWRSRRESLMWSERRNSWEGFVPAMVHVIKGGWDVEVGGVDDELTMRRWRLEDLIVV